MSEALFQDATPAVAIQLATGPKNTWEGTSKAAWNERTDGRLNGWKGWKAFHFIFWVTFQEQTVYFSRI